MPSNIRTEKVVAAVRDGSTVAAAALKYRVLFHVAYRSVVLAGLHLSGRKRRLAEERGVELVRSGMDRQQAAAEVGVCRSLIDRACLRARIDPDINRRTVVTREEWTRVDWKFRDFEIAAMLGVSRERVRQVRAKLGKPKIKRGVSAKSPLSE